MSTAAARPRTRLHLFALFTALYFASTSGTFVDNADALFMFGVADGLAREGTLGMTPEIESRQPPVGAYEHLRGRGGRLYMPKGMLQSTLSAPFVWAGGAVSRLLGAPDLPVEPRGAMFAASLVAPLVSAAQVVLVMEIALVLGFGAAASLATAVAVGLGTIVWADSKGGNVEPLNGLLFTAAFLSIVHVFRGALPRAAAACGGCAALLILNQPAMAVAAPVLGVFVAWGAFRAAPRKQALLGILSFISVTALGLLVLAAINAHRYGSPWLTGYEWANYQTRIPLWVGFYGLYLSAGKSVFLYSPPLLCVLWAMPRFVRAAGPAALLPLALLATFSVGYGHLSYWNGDGAWGPRYVVPLTATLGVSLAVLLGPNATPRQRTAVWTSVIAGALVQCVGVTTSTVSYFMLLIGHGRVAETPDSYAWSPIIFHPELSPIPGRTRLLFSGLRRLFGGDSLHWHLHGPGTGTQAIPLAGHDAIDLWPWRVLGEAGAAPRWGVALVLFAVIAFSATRLVRDARALSR